MIVYLHGFNSSPRSHKAQYLRAYLEGRGRAAEYACPDLPHHPADALAVAEAEIAKHPQGSVTLLGSSLGGFYATWLSERHGVRSALVNPAIDPHVGLRAHVGPQRVYYSDETWELTEAHVAEFERYYVQDGLHPDRYLLLVETGDEVLDYRLAVQRYRGARQIVVPGGDHTFTTFAEHLPAILEFAGKP